MRIKNGEFFENPPLSLRTSSSEEYVNDGDYKT